MTNIAFIRAVEFQGESRFIKLNIQNGSAAYEDKQSNGVGGVFHKHTLKFRIASINSSNEAYINALRLARVVRFSDVNGVRTTLGTTELPVQVSVEKNNGGRPGSFRGYDISVSWESADDAPIESFI